MDGYLHSATPAHYQNGKSTSTGHHETVYPGSTNLHKGLSHGSMGFERLLFAKKRKSLHGSKSTSAPSSLKLDQKFSHPDPTGIPNSSDPICKSLEFVEPRTCQHINNYQPHMKCPDGFHLDGQSCISYTRTPAQFSTPEPVERRRPADLVCPIHGCVLKEWANPIYYCPPKFVMKGEQCVEYGDLIQPEPQERRTGPHLVCPIPDPYAGHACATVEYAHKIVYCKDGWALTDNKCLRTAQLERPPPKVVLTKPNLLCSKGAELRGKRCIITTVAPTEAVCPF
eukprot:GHVN01054392.1.p2 GENE.GHVN01054392.1~~GHVN01054392.1.p2  ORF type:complete len:283 (-),score=9.89 GHVN01054392.1:140-988(-)